MSFAFDPNENIHRAEVDNDPQDVESYVGGEDSLVEFPAVPKLEEPPIDPKDIP